MSGSFCNSGILNSTVFVCHIFRCSSEIVNNTLNKTIKKFSGTDKNRIEENESVYIFFFAKIIFDANDSKRKVKTSCCYCRFLSCKKRFKDTHSETKPLLKIQIYAKSMKRYEDLGFKS